MIYAIQHPLLVICESASRKKLFVQQETTVFYQLLASKQTALFVVHFAAVNGFH
jgi:hypothetical protein